MKIEIMRYPELECDVCYEIDEHFVQVKAYRHTGMTTNCEPMFETENYQPTSNLAESAVWFEMTVKWDGCAHWITPEQRAGIMSHICDYSEFNQFNNAIKQAYRDAHGYMPMSDVETFRE